MDPAVIRNSVTHYKHSEVLNASPNRRLFKCYPLRNPGCKSVQLLGKNSWPKKLYLVVKMNYILLKMFHISQNKKYLLYRNSLRIHEVARKMHDDDTMMRYGTRWHQSHNIWKFFKEK
jgi:hypothetical protein